MTQITFDRAQEIVGMWLKKDQPAHARNFDGLTRRIVEAVADRLSGDEVTLLQQPGTDEWNVLRRAVSAAHGVNRFERSPRGTSYYPMSMMSSTS